MQGLDVICQKGFIDFWTDFSQGVWEQAPMAAPHGFTHPPFAGTPLFNDIVAACDFGDGDQGVELRFFVDGTRCEIVDIYELLPKELDGTLEGYHARVLSAVKEAGGREYTLIINNLEAVSVTFWEWSRSFLRGLFDRVGYNKLGVYGALFLGNYRETPFGVHLDPEGVFHLPLAGTKRILTFEPAVVDQHPELRNSCAYHHCRDRAQVLEAGPGGFLYWPSKSWHIGEFAGQTVDELSASLALSLNIYPTVMDYFAKVITERYAAVHKKEQARAPLRPGPVDGAEDPAELRTAVEALQREAASFADPGYWLRLRSGSAFLKTPRPLPAAPLADADRVATHPGFPLPWRASAGELLIGAGGYVFGLPDSPAARAALADLNATENFRSVAELVTRGEAAAVPGTTLRRLLENLVRHHGLRVLRASHPT